MGYRAIAFGMPSLHYSYFHQRGGLENFFGHFLTFQLASLVPAESRGRRVRYDKAFRDYVRDALSGLARGKCHRAIQMR